MKGGQPGRGSSPWERGAEKGPRGSPGSDLLHLCRRGLTLAGRVQENGEGIPRGSLQRTWGIERGERILGPAGRRQRLALRKENGVVRAEGPGPGEEAPRSPRSGSAGSAKEGPQNRELQGGRAQQGNTPPSPRPAPRAPLPQPGHAPHPPAARAGAGRGRGRARGLGRGGGFKRVIRRGARDARDAALGAAALGAAARMASARRPAGARLLLVYAGLLAAAAGLGSPEPGAPSRSRAREEPSPGNELPWGPGESRAGPAARLPVRRPGPLRTQPAPTSSGPGGGRRGRARPHPRELLQCPAPGLR